MVADALAAPFVNENTPWESYPVRQSHCHTTRHVTFPLMSDKVTFKKSTSRPAQRTRDVDADHDDGEQSTTDTPISLVSKLKSKAKRSQPKSRLSFGVDDGVSVLHPSLDPP